MYTINIDILTNTDPHYVISKIEEIPEIDIEKLSWSACKHKKFFNDNDGIRKRNKKDYL